MAIALGVGGLLGWILDITALKSVLPGLASMRVNTALAFLFAGSSLHLRLARNADARRKLGARVSALVVFAVGAITLVEYALAIEDGIDQLFFRLPPAETIGRYPARMAPNSALAFTLLGPALAVLDPRSNAVRAALQGSALVVFGIAFIAIVGYLFDARTLHGLAGHTSMAAHTAAGFIFLSAGMLAASPDRGVVAVIVQDNAAGATLRRILPVLLLAPLAVGWLRLAGQRLGLYGTEFGLAIMVTVTTGIVVSTALRGAHVQGRAQDAEQQSVQDERFLLTLSEELRTVADPDEVLATVSATLASELDVSRCFFALIDDTKRLAKIERDYHRDLRSLAGTVPLASFGAVAVAEAEAGRTVSNDDAEHDERTAEEYASGCLPIGLRAHINVPILQDGHWAALLVVSTHEPRRWRRREIALVESAADRTWLWREHLRAAAATRESEELFRVALDAAPTGMLMSDEAGTIVLVNRHVEGIFGYRRGELVERAVESIVPEAVRSRHEGLRATFFENPTVRMMGAGRDLHGTRKDGTDVPVEVGLSPVVTRRGRFVLASIADATERRRAEAEREDLLARMKTLNLELEARVVGRTAALSRALEEREVLLKEVHHRVKNNLQVISSMINMQVRQLGEGSGRDALVDCRSRVQTIALIHERLYQSGDYANVPFSEYIRSLVTNVVEALGTARAAITLELTVDEVRLGVDQAIPCGLILNELITNAFKHAFVGASRGHIQVRLRNDTACGAVVLAVIDDGVALPAGFEPRTVSSLGMVLVATLVDQLDGRLELRAVGSHGKEFRVTFSPGPAKETSG